VLVHGGRCVAHSTKRVFRDPAIKKLYNSPQWKTMRAAQLAKEPWCVDCLDRNVHTLATEVDHIIPHRGEPALFFDPNNLASRCKPDHSRKTADEVFR
jgi:HNH endonuclease.